MNFLAHVFLSEPEPLVRLGNLTADFVKGPRAFASLDPRLQRGIRFHRALDHFTDTHPEVRDAAALLAPGWGRWAPVLTDIFYDHFLATDFDRYSDVSLGQFIEDFHVEALAHIDVLPARGQEWLRRVVAENRLASYGTVDGIGRALGRLTRIAHRAPDLTPAASDMVRHDAELRAGFHRFFPALQGEAARLHREWA